MWPLKTKVRKKLKYMFVKKALMETCKFHMYSGISFRGRQKNLFFFSLFLAIFRNRQYVWWLYKCLPVIRKTFPFCVWEIFPGYSWIALIFGILDIKGIRPKWEHIFPWGLKSPYTPQNQNTIFIESNRSAVDISRTHHRIVSNYPASGHFPLFRQEKKGKPHWQ